MVPLDARVQEVSADQLSPTWYREGEVGITGVSVPNTQGGYKLCYL
jgi:hypothetical protein